MPVTRPVQSLILFRICRCVFVSRDVFRTTPHHVPASVKPFTGTDLDSALQTLKCQRRHWPADSDIWDLIYHWPVQRQYLLQQLNSGAWRLTPMLVVHKSRGDTCVIWPARDALVLHALTTLLTPNLPVHPRCEHVKGHQGGRQSTRRVHHFLRNAPSSFVFRTDIRGYYVSINKDRLYRQLTGYIACPVLLSLLWQFLHYSVEEGGHFHTPRNGIPRVRYARYMDDFILIAPTRHTLRRAIKTLKQLMHDYGFVLHPDKTQPGRTRKGFDWMGLWFTDKGITAFAPRATEKHRLKCRQLYEQIRNLTPESQALRMAAYRRRWVNALLPQDITHDIPDYDSEYVTVNASDALELSSP